MKNKRIDFFLRKEQWKKESKSIKYGSMTIASIIILIFLLGTAAFLILDTARMDKKTAEGEAMLNDPQLLEFHKKVESLNQQENMYLAIKESLANLDIITATYPNVDREFFNHLLLGNDPGVAISGMSYDGASGQFSFGVTAQGYGSWSKFITKMENSNYFTEFSYYGYDKDIEADRYSSAFSVQLLKIENTVTDGEGE